MDDQRHGRERRVRRRADFEDAYRVGHKVVRPPFVLFARPNGLETSRLGVTATRKIGNAVIRNRARRLVREAYRRVRASLPSGYDLVVVVRPPLLALSAPDLGPLLVEAAAAAAGEER